MAVRGLEWLTGPLRGKHGFGGKHVRGAGTLQRRMET